MMEVIWRNSSPIARYLPDAVEYPGGSLFDGMEWGVLYKYVNNWLVQGALCLAGRASRAWLLERYDAFDPANYAEIERKSTENSCRWINWSEFDDDVIVLARGDGAGEWWLFWFDQDVSDCRLGRFKSDDDLDTISAAIEQWIDSKTDHAKAGVVRSDDSGCGWETLSAWRRLPDEWAPRLTFS